MLLFLTLPALEGGEGGGFFYCCILTGSSLGLFYMTFPLIYIEQVTSKILLISQIICQDQCVCQWLLMTVAYYGFTDSD